MSHWGGRSVAAARWDPQGHQGALWPRGRPASPQCCCHNAPPCSPSSALASHPSPGGGGAVGGHRGELPHPAEGGTQLRSTAPQFTDLPGGTACSAGGHSFAPSPLASTCVFRDIRSWKSVPAYPGPSPRLTELAPFPSSLPPFSLAAGPDPDSGFCSLPLPPGEDSLLCLGAQVRAAPTPLPGHPCRHL